MMGYGKGGQERLFYSFNLEDHVPQDHLLRGIDSCLDLSGLRHHLAEHYSHTGRPSVNPELMIRMLIIGYSYGIRSERRLCEEVHPSEPGLFLPTWPHLSFDGTRLCSLFDEGAVLPEHDISQDRPQCP